MGFFPVTHGSFNPWVEKPEELCRFGGSNRKGDDDDDCLG
jgi:hypothetical protein